MAKKGGIVTRRSTTPAAIRYSVSLARRIFPIFFLFSLGFISFIRFLDLLFLFLLLLFFFFFFVLLLLRLLPILLLLLLQDLLDSFAAEILRFIPVLILFGCYALDLPPQSIGLLDKLFPLLDVEPFGLVQGILSP